MLKYFQSIFSVRPLWSSKKCLPQMQHVVGLNPTEGKICFSHLINIEWNVKNCFVKYKLKSNSKLNKTMK